MTSKTKATIDIDNFVSEIKRNLSALRKAADKGDFAKMSKGERKEISAKNDKAIILAEKIKSK